MKAKKKFESKNSEVKPKKKKKKNSGVKSEI